MDNCQLDSRQHCDAISATASQRHLYPVYTIEQTSNKRRENAFKIHVLIARRLLDVC